MNIEGVRIIDGPKGAIVVVTLAGQMKFENEKQRLEEAASVLKREVLRYGSINRGNVGGANDNDGVPERPFPDR